MSEFRSTVERTAELLADATAEKTLFKRLPDRLLVEDTATTALRDAQAAQGYALLAIAEELGQLRTQLNAQRGDLLAVTNALRGLTNVTLAGTAQSASTAQQIELLGEVYKGEQAELRLALEQCVAEITDSFEDNAPIMGTGRPRFWCLHRRGRQGVEQ